MKHYFSGFQLDTHSQELTFKGQRVELTKRTYDLLSFLVSNPQQLHSKDDLINHVWKNRVVSGNTIDQTVLTLKKKLAEYCQDDFIESVYGQGIKWVAEHRHKYAVKKRPWVLTAAIIFIISLILYVYHFLQKTEHLETNAPNVVMQLPESLDPDSMRSTGEYLQQILTFSNQAQVVNNNERPQFLSTVEFIQNQQKLNPQLTLIKISAIEDQPNNDKNMAWLIEVTQAQHVLVEQIIYADNQHALLLKSGQILAKALQFEQLSKRSLFPDDGTVVNLYVRGLHRLSSHQFSEAAELLKLAIQEQPYFNLARLKLAETFHAMGQNDEANKHINVLLTVDALASIKLSAHALKARIMRLNGQLQAAVDIYEGMFQQAYKVTPVLWHNTQYEYASLLRSMNKPQAALKTFDSIITTTEKQKYSYSLGKIFAAKASLLQQQGDIKNAGLNAEQALRIFQLNKDTVGTARSLTLLARMANHQANYHLAEERLHQALETLSEVDYALGEGAILNELIYTLMVQGKHESAWTYNNRLLNIAIKIDYNAMHLSALRAFFDMSRVQYRWQEAEQYLEKYQKLAIQTEDKRRQTKAHLMQLDLWLDQGITNALSDKIDLVQSHIDDSNEFRMQPTLSIKKARFQWLTGLFETAIETLEIAKQSAYENKDYESIITANNLMAEYYLQQNKAQMALNVLSESEPYNPFAVPYLRLKAEAYLDLNQSIKAYETILLCQQKANDLWRSKEQALLIKIKTSINQ
ncbi:MAG: winged helix-turn-helix domain-containing protein [Marinicella pacifica]